jgi:phosphopantothenoylcysteine synthetase/decarboxylase
MSSADRARVLCVVVCGAGPAPHISTLVDLAHADGWSVRIVATPSGLGFLDAAALQQQTGSPVQADYTSNAREPRVRNSAADALIVAPATYNTINKLALGINDTYALNVVAEAIGRGTPTAILPFVNSALAARQPFLRSIQSLRDENVRVVFGPGQWTPHPPGEGNQQLTEFPWHLVLAAVCDQ